MISSLVLHTLCFFLNPPEFETAKVWQLRRSPRPKGGDVASMLTILCALMLSSSDESDGDFPASCIQQLGASRIDPGRNGLPLDSDDEVETPTRVPNWNRCSTTSRGRHSRDGAATKLTHADQAHAAWEAVQSTALAGACDASCPFGCEDRLKRNEMFLCIESSYGAIEWVSNAALRVSKRQPTTSYGKESVRDGEAGLRSMCAKCNPDPPQPWCHSLKGRGCRCTHETHAAHSSAVQVWSIRRQSR